MLKHVVDDFLDVREVLGWIGEDDVELVPAGGGKSESILPDHRHLVVVLQLVDGLLDKLSTQHVLVNSHH